MNNKCIKIIDKIKYVKFKTSKMSNNCKMTFISSDNIFIKIYSAIKSKIYNILYSIRLGIKFINIFNYE